MSSSIAYKTLSDDDNVDKTSSMIVQVTDDDDMRTECSDKKGGRGVESNGSDGSDAEGSGSESSDVGKKEKDNMTRALLGNEESSSCIDSGNEDLNVSDLNHLASSSSDIRSYCQTWEEASKNTISIPSCYHDETLNKMNIHDEEDMIQKRTQDRSCFSFLQFIFSIFRFNKKN